jgi:pSer/pThr/pTyr-binding forkhead associated (FHA) protein
MAFIEYGGKRHVVPSGDMLIGTGADCHLRLDAPGVALRHAVLTTAPDLSVAIRRLAEAAAIEVNGVQLGPLPQPLLHGDKVTLGGVDLLFVDERKSGSTQYVSAVDLAKLAASASKPKAAGAGKATAATGGRVVSLTDGREYTVAGNSLTFGRDANSDVVVSGGQVSRRHAEIVTTPRGYVLVDSSTNGVFVNGERVQGQRLLARADVVRIGEEEFRFYADAAPAAAAPEPVVAAPLAAPPPPAPAAPAAVPVAADAAPVRPAAPPPPFPPPPPPAPGVPQLASTGYFATPATPPPVSPRTGEDLALPNGPKAATPPMPPPPPPPAPPKAPSVPIAAKSGPEGALAKFLVRSGSLKGQRLYVKVPIVNIGRAEYNDLVVPDDSVSSQHAKLTRREGVWVLTDLGSTNGTLVDGERIAADTPIAPGAYVRFGDVQLVFEPTDDDAGIKAPQGTRAISAVKITDLKPPSGH